MSLLRWIFVAFVFIALLFISLQNADPVPLPAAFRVRGVATA